MAGVAEGKSAKTMMSDGRKEVLAVKSRHSQLKNTTIEKCVTFNIVYGIYDIKMIYIVSWAGHGVIVPKVLTSLALFGYDPVVHRSNNRIIYIDYIVLRPKLEIPDNHIQASSLDCNGLGTCHSELVPSGS